MKNVEDILEKLREGGFMSLSLKDIPSTLKIKTQDKISNNNILNWLMTAVSH